MTTILLMIAAVLALVLSAFSSGTETGIYCLNHVRLRVYAERKEPAAQRLLALMKRQEDLVITALLGTNVADYVATACITALLLHLQVPAQRSEVYATLILTPLVLVFGGIIPKDLFRRQSDRLMYPLALPLLIAANLARLTGVVWMLRTLSRAVIRRIDPEAARRHEEIIPRTQMLRLLHEGAVRGGLTELQRDIIQRVMNISKVRIGQIMIPRNRAAYIPQDIARDDFLRIARMSHFSRLPVTGGERRRVVGIVNVYDVITDDEARPVRAHVHDAVRLSPALTVSTALFRLQQARQTMAIVEDARGNFIGLLTVKDLVQEIVGELEVW